MKGVQPARATRVIAALTALAWVVAALWGAQDWAATQLGFIPARAYAGGALTIVPFWLTPLTATLVHGGLVHLAFNLLLFVYCGQRIEAELGPGPLVALYLLGAYGAASGQFFAGPHSLDPMIGASGAISAVLAIYALLFGRNEVRGIGPVPAHWVRALWLLAAWVGLQVLVGVATRGGGMAVATAAHVGGFLAGLVVSRPVLSWRYGMPKPRPRSR